MILLDDDFQGQGQNSPAEQRKVEILNNARWHWKLSSLITSTIALFSGLILILWGVYLVLIMEGLHIEEFIASVLLLSIGSSLSYIAYSTIKNRTRLAASNDTYNKALRADFSAYNPYNIQLGVILLLFTALLVLALWETGSAEVFEEGWDQPMVTEPMEPEPMENPETIEVLLEDLEPPALLDQEEDAN